MVECQSVNRTVQPDQGDINMGQQDDSVSYLQTDLVRKMPTFFINFLFDFTLMIIKVIQKSEQ